MCLPCTATGREARRSVKAVECPPETGQRTVTVWQCVPETKAVPVNDVERVQETRTRQESYTVRVPTTRNVTPEHQVCVRTYRDVEEVGPRQVDPAEQPLKEFVSVVLADTEDVWRELFPKHLSVAGDDRLQKQARGYVVPDSFTDGTFSQRARWFRWGPETGDLSLGKRLFEVPKEEL